MVAVAEYEWERMATSPASEVGAYELLDIAEAAPRACSSAIRGVVTLGTAAGSIPSG
jgi:hypothetical protein